MSRTDRDILRPLVEEYLPICRSAVQDERRALWRDLNGLRGTRPLVYARRFAWPEMPECRTECRDPLLGGVEGTLRRNLFWATLGDDAVFEPWITLGAVYRGPRGETLDGNLIKDTAIWGVPVEWIGNPGGARRWVPPLEDPQDVERLVPPRHLIDEAATARRVETVREAIGDLIPVAVDRGPVYRSYCADISTHLALLRGLEQMMLDMMDRPEWLHGLLAFMRDGILAAQQEAEDDGDWCLTSQWNQAELYATDFEDPAPDVCGVRRDRLWAFCAAQEFAQVSPAMFDEFVLQYQIPILARFGLVHYGCCEDLSEKIGFLRRIPNLRRIGIGLHADVARCAEQIGTDYVLSYRPSPADMVGYGFDADRVRRILRRDLAAARGCHVDVTLKDVETVQGDPGRVREWVRIAREVIDEVWHARV